VKIRANRATLLVVIMFVSACQLGRPGKVFSIKASPLP
jgi:hypothetical protein